MTESFCPVCGYEGKNLDKLPYGFCSKSCKMLSTLEDWEDQEKTSTSGWEVFDEGNFLLTLAKDPELSLTKTEILAIGSILYESKNQNSKFNSKFNSRYWVVHEQLIFFFKESRIGRNL